MSAPADADKVIKAFRFGWALAEVRGRYRPGTSLVLPPPTGPRADHALPLFDERSETEQLIELHKLLTGLGGELGVDGDVSVNGANPIKRSAKLADLGTQLRSNPTPALWSELTEFIYSWDADIQDQLVLEASQSAAYQLGRGLAETYWALDPTIEDANDWRSWQFLLSARRCLTFGRLVARLVDYMDPLTPPAVTISLNAWAKLALDQQRRSGQEVLKDLYDQVLLWRDLIRSERRPQDLVASIKPFTRIGIIVPVLKAFYLQILLAIAGAGLLAVSAAELAAGGATTKNALIAILSGLGITSTALYARAKGIANSLTDQLKTAFARDRVGEAATLTPKRQNAIAAAVGASGRQEQLNSASPRLTQGWSTD